MSTAKHTPGPWTAYGVTITGAKGLPIAETKGAFGQPAEANARLIAAAPELAAALRALINASDTAVFDEDDCGETSGRFNSTVWAARAARAALAKAGL